MLFSIISSMLYGPFAVFRLDYDYATEAEYLATVDTLNMNFYKYTEDQRHILDTIMMVCEIFYVYQAFVSSVTFYVDPRSQ
jgi:hypothetical protein